jgi:hypothetical protein
VIQAAVVPAAAVLVVGLVAAVVRRVVHVIFKQMQTLRAGLITAPVIDVLYIGQWFRAVERT